MSDTAIAVVEGPITSVTPEVTPDPRLARIDNRLVEQKRLEIANNWQGSLSTKMAYQMAKLSVAYGLDPFLKELIVLGDNVYPTVAALHRKANEDPTYDGEELRPATPEERISFYGPLAPPEDEHLWKCLVHLKNRAHPVVGWGRASIRNVQMKTMQIWLPEMAQKRARGRAYRIAFNIGVPTIEEMYEFEDGTNMVRNAKKEVIQVATPGDIERIEEKILVQSNLDSKLMTVEEWDRVKEVMSSGSVTKAQADSIIKYFLGTKDVPGVIEMRRNENQ